MKVCAKWQVRDPTTMNYVVTKLRSFSCDEFEPEILRIRELCFRFLLHSDLIWYTSLSWFFRFQSSEISASSFCYSFLLFSPLIFCVCILDICILHIWFQFRRVTFRIKRNFLFTFESCAHIYIYIYIIMIILTKIFKQLCNFPKKSDPRILIRFSVANLETNCSGENISHDVSFSQDSN